MHCSRNLALKVSSYGKDLFAFWVGGKERREKEKRQKPRVRNRGTFELGEFAGLVEGAFERVQLAERLAFALLGVVEMVALASYLAEALLSFFFEKRESSFCVGDLLGFF